MHSHFNIHSHFIEALLINDIDKVKTFLKDPDFRVIFKAEEYFSHVIKEKNIELFTILFNDKRFDNDYSNGTALREATKNHFYQAVELLLTDNDIDLNNACGLPIRVAFRNYAENKKSKDIEKTFLLLWNNEKIKSYLKKEQKYLYTDILEETIANKLVNF